MDVDFRKKIHLNGLIYQRSLERIIAKYSKLQDQDGDMEVDLNTTNLTMLRRYMRQSKMKLDELGSINESLGNSREESMESQDSTRDSELDLSHHEERTRQMSTNLLSDQDNAPSQRKTSETLRLWDDSQRKISAMELQPEDEDDEQEMSLRSQGGCLADLYPNTISQIGRAWRRQRVSEAADSVRRRYRVWRHLSNKSNLSMISNTTLRKTRNSNKTNRETQINKTINSPLKKHVFGNKGEEAAYLSPLRIGNRVKYCQAQHHHRSPEKGIGLQRREQHPPVLVMDLSSCSFEDTLRKNTFTIPHPSPQRSQPSAYAVSPSRPCHPSAKAQDISFRSKLFSVSPLAMQVAGCSIQASGSPVSKEKPDVCGSPVRHSPFKARLTSREGRGGSPYAFSASPKSYSQSYSRELMRSRSASTSLSSPPQTSPASRRRLHYQDSRPIIQSQVHPPAAVQRHRLRRCLSFDSSLPPNRVSYTAKELDDDFVKLFHKFVCQSKSPIFMRIPCRMCERSSAASRGHSSSDLAAPPLLPHRSLLKKRYREVKLDDHLLSSSSREGYYTCSPGSRRYFRKMQTRRFPPSDMEVSHGHRHSTSVNSPVLQKAAPSRSRSVEESQPVYF